MWRESIATAREKTIMRELQRTDDKLTMTLSDVRILTTGITKGETEMTMRIETERKTRVLRLIYLDL